MVRRGLTLRGWALLLAACAVAAVAALLGQSDLLRVAVLLAALPVLSMLFVWWATPRVQLQRIVEQPVTQVGHSQEVRLRVRNPGRLPSGTLLLAECVDRGLGRSPRVVVPALGAGAQGHVRYEIVPRRRGRWELGPSSLQVVDPFGLCLLGHSWQATDTVVVRPRVHTLTPLGLVGTLSDDGESSRLSAVGLGDPDLTLRDYRSGDDRRHVHWKATARRGRLVVRQEELPHQPRGTVLLDATADAFGEEGPWLEWAIEVAASVGLRLATDGFSTRLLVDGVDPGWAAPSSPELSARLLDPLAILTRTGQAELGAAAEVVARGGDGVLVAVVTGGALPDRLLRLPRLGGTALAVVLDPARWHRDGAPVGPASRVAAQLEREGWCAVSAGAADPVERVWDELLRRHRASYRAAG